MSDPRCTGRWLAPVAVALASVGAIAIGPRAAAVLVLTALVVPVGALAPLSVLVAALVVSCQLTGGRFEFGPYRFLPEHVVLLMFLGAVLLRVPRLLLRPAAAYEMLFLAWILWNGTVSVFYSPEPAESLAIVAWMGLAWLMLWCVRSYFLAEPEHRGRILDIGAQAAALLGAAAFAMWASALAFGTGFGVQPDYVTGSIASKGFAFEANFLGSQEMFWLYLVIRRKLLGERHLSPWQIAGMVLGLVCSMTRAVWLAVGVVLVGALAARRLTTMVLPDGPGRPHRRSLGQVAAGGLCLSGLVVMLGTPAAQKFRATLDFDSVTGQSRVVAWKTAWQDLEQSGSFHTGLGANSFAQRHPSPTIRGEPDYLGNLPLSILYDGGLIGVLLFSGAILCLIARGGNARGWLLNIIFVLALMIVGAATNPIWMGFVWVTIAAIASDPPRRALLMPARGSQTPADPAPTFPRVQGGRSGDHALAPRSSMSAPSTGSS